MKPEASSKRTDHHYGCPLEVKIERDALVIRVGVQTLAHAATYADWAYECEEGELHNEYIRRFAIANPWEFARDVMHAMLREAEDGSSPLSDFIDEASKAAVDDGSLGCEYDQRIEHGKTSDWETWAQSGRDE